MMNNGMTNNNGMMNNNGIGNGNGTAGNSQCDKVVITMQEYEDLIKAFIGAMLYMDNMQDNPSYMQSMTGGYNQQQGYNYSQPNGQQMGYNQQQMAYNQQPVTIKVPEANDSKPDEKSKIKVITKDNAHLFLDGMKNGVLVIPEQIEKICSHSFNSTEIKEIKIEPEKLEVERNSFDCLEHVKKIYVKNYIVCLSLCESSWKYQNLIQKSQLEIFINGEKFTPDEYEKKKKAEGPYTYYIRDGILTIPEQGLKIINEQVFQGCDSTNVNGIDHINNIDLALCKYVYQIDKGTFKNCKKLKKIVLDSIGMTNTNAFAGCDNLEEIHTKTVEQCRIIYSGFDEAARNRFKEGKLSIFYENNKAKLEDVDMAAYAAVEGNIAADGRLTIPDGTIEISSKAFENNSKVKVIEGSSVIEIHEEAFCNCENLTEVIFKSASCIGKNAFVGCNNLEKIYLKDINACKQLYDNCPEMKRLATMGKLKLFAGINEVSYTDLAYTQEEKAKLSNLISIQNGIIGNYENDDLRSFLVQHAINNNRVLIIPKGINEISFAAFSREPHCDFYKIIIEPDCLYIGPNAFYYDETTEEVYTKNIEMCIKLYRECANLRNRFINGEADFYVNNRKIDIGDLYPYVSYNNATEINKWNELLFLRKMNNRVLIIPKNIKKIANDLFQNKEDIKEVRIETSKIEIGNNIFNRSSNIEKIYTKDIEICRDICRKNKDIYKRNWENELNFYVNDKEVKAENLFVHIWSDNESFFLERARKNGGVLIIPENIQKIDDDLFQGKKDIKVVKFETSNVEIGSNIFYDSSDIKEIYTKDVEICKAVCEINKELKKKFIKGEVQFYVGDKKIDIWEMYPILKYDTATVTEINKDNELLFLEEMQDGVLTIPENIQKIDDDLFRNNEDIEEVRIETSNVKIGFDVFYNSCSISKIYTKNIEMCRHLFTQCGTVQFLASENKLHLYVNDEEVKVEDVFVFIVFDFNESFFLKKAMENDGVLTIPENIKKIYSNRFQNNEDIKEVRIESSDIFIGNNVFDGSSSISKIYTKDIKICRDLCRKCSMVGGLASENELHFYVNDKEVEEENVVPWIWNENEPSFLKKAKENSGVLIIPENIRVIYDNLLQYNEDIKEVRIENSNITIHKDVFEGSPNISKIYTKDIKVCKALCENTEELKWKFIEGKIDFYVNERKIDIGEIYPNLNYGTVEEINRDNELLFLKKMNNGVLTIPENIKKINDNLFQKKEDISVVIIKNSEVEIGNHIFEGSENISKIYTNNIEICRHLYRRCKKVQHLALENKLHFYVNNAKVEVEDVMVCIQEDYEEYFFINKAMKNNGVLIIPKSIQKIGDYRFVHIGSVREVRIENSDIVIINKDFLAGRSGTVKKIYTANIETCKNICQNSYVRKSAFRDQFHFYVNDKKIDINDIYDDDRSPVHDDDDSSY